MLFKCLHRQKPGEARRGPFNLARGRPAPAWGPRASRSSSAQPRSAAGTPAPGTGAPKHLTANQLAGRGEHTRDVLAEQRPFHTWRRGPIWVWCLLGETFILRHFQTSLLDRLPISGNSWGYKDRSGGIEGERSLSRSFSRGDWVKHPPERTRMKEQKHRMSPHPKFPRSSEGTWRVPKTCLVLLMQRMDITNKCSYSEGM